MIVDNLSTSYTRKKPPQWMAICFRSAKVALKTFRSYFLVTFRLLRFGNNLNSRKEVFCGIY